jgi:hypothetical protein
VPQQETLQMLTSPHHYPAHGAAQPDQVTHGLMRLIGHPDRCQLTGSMETGQHRGIAAVGLDAVARFAGDQGRRHHLAAMAEAGQLAMKTIAAGMAS